MYANRSNLSIPYPRICRLLSAELTVLLRILRLRSRPAWCFSRFSAPFLSRRGGFNWYIEKLHDESYEYQSVLTMIYIYGIFCGIHSSHSRGHSICSHFPFLHILFLWTFTVNLHVHNRNIPKMLYIFYREQIVFSTNTKSICRVPNRVSVWLLEAERLRRTSRDFEDSMDRIQLTAQATFRWLTLRLLRHQII